MKIKNKITGETILEIETLIGANLKDVNLQNADLRGADLRGADLTCANLEDADFEDANLEKTIFEGANLRRANVKNANLKGAYFSSAYLIDVNLKEAKVKPTDIELAHFKEFVMPSTTDKVIIEFQRQIIVDINLLLKYNCYWKSGSEDKDMQRGFSLYISELHPEDKIKVIYSNRDEVKGLLKPYVEIHSNKVSDLCEFHVKIINDRINYVLNFQSQLYINIGSSESPSYTSVNDIVHSKCVNGKLD